MLDGFTLEGVNYRQEYRRCGKPTCTRCNDGDGHGPYWYSNGKVSGVRQYIGTDLPPAVTAARLALGAQRREIEAQRDRLQEQARALDALVHHNHLSSMERSLIRWMGFGDCLVQPGGQQTAQDASPNPASPYLVDVLTSGL